VFLVGIGGSARAQQAPRVELRVKPASAQAASPPVLKPFTPEDMLNVVTPTVLDVTDDGRRVAIAARRPYDNQQVDNVRYGDPTDLAPARSDLLVVDTQARATDVPFKELVNVRQAVWAHDGSRLAIITADNGSSPDRPVTHLFLWHADRRALADVTVRGGRVTSMPSPAKPESAATTCRAPAGRWAFSKT